MRTRNIVIGFLAVIGIAALLYNSRGKENTPAIEPTPTPSVEAQIEERFSTQIPDAAERAELADVSGGDGRAIAARTFADGTFSLTILADIPEPQTGQSYYGWLGRESEGETEYLRVGVLRVAKGGWVLEYRASRDLSNYTKVSVSAEQSVGNAPGTKILEGSF